MKYTEKELKEIAKDFADEFDMEYDEEHISIFNEYGTLFFMTVNDDLLETEEGNNLDVEIQINPFLGAHSWRNDNEEIEEYFDNVQDLMEKADIICNTDF